MIDKREAKNLRGRLEEVARGHQPDQRLWLEVHSLRHRRHGRRWKGVICQHEEVTAVFAGRNPQGAVFGLDYPSQLPEWLDALGVRPVEPMPDDWNTIMFFGCDVEVLEKETARS
jgi:hypothetical protein